MAAVLVLAARDMPAERRRAAVPFFFGRNGVRRSSGFMASRIVLVATRV
jgi:hypothetical protein